MKLQQILDSSWLGGALMLAGACVLGGLCLVVFLPGWISLTDNDATAAVVAEGDRSWQSAAQVNPFNSELDGAEVYATLGPESGGAEGSLAIDDSWLSGGGAGADQSALEELACIIEPFYSVEIGSPVTGLIDTIYVEWGDFVEAGQILVELESDAERATVQLARAQSQMTEEIESAKARAALIERRRKRLIKLYEQNTLSLDLREEVETEAEVARIELEQAPRWRWCRRGR